MMHRSFAFRFVLFFMLFFSCKVAVAQSGGDLETLKAHCKDVVKTGGFHKETAHKKLFFPGRVLFGFYRAVLSEQIAADCAFDLTCSRFSISAIRHFGILKGGFLTADRLTRCHIFVAQETVPIHFNNYTGKVIDVPGMY